MPLREYVCPNGHVTDELFDGEYPKSIRCECGERAAYRIAPVTFKLDFRYGWDAGAGKYFDSARQRDTFLDKNNLTKNPDGAYDQPYKEPVKV